MLRDDVRVILAPEGFYPQSVRWQSRWVRVLLVEDVYTCAQERRYRVRTPEGVFELGYRTGAGAWRMHRAPAWFQRIWAGVQRLPRYPLPAQRRRGSRTRAAQPAAARRWPTPAPLLVRAPSG